MTNILIAAEVKRGNRPSTFAVAGDITALLVIIDGVGYIGTENGAFHPGGGETWLGWFFVVGLVAALVLGFWLLLVIWGSGRR